MQNLVQPNASPALKARFVTDQILEGSVTQVRTQTKTEQHVLHVRMAGFARQEDCARGAKMAAFQMVDKELRRVLQPALSAQKGRCVKTG